MRGTKRVAEDRARGEDMVGEAARVGVLLADAPPGLVHQESVEDVGGFVDGGGDGLGGERGEPVGDVRVRLDAGLGSVAGVDQVEGFAAAGGREELAIARGGPSRTPDGRHRQGGLGLDDHGQRPVVRFAFDVPACDAHQFPEPVRGRGFGHLAQAEIDALGEQHVEQADAVATGRPGAQVREGLGEPGGVVHLKQDVRDPRVGYPLIEVGDEVAGPVRHGGCGPFDAEHAIVDAGTRDRTGSRRGVQPPQTLVQRALALREPVLRIGRDRQAAVGINNSGSRQQQRLPDVAVAARPRQPEVAGAERIAQVEQHRRLPQAVVGLGAQQPAPLRIRAGGSQSAAPWQRCARRRRLPARAWPRADASMSSVRSMRGV